MFHSSPSTATSYGDLLQPACCPITTSTTSAAASAYGSFDVNSSSFPLPVLASSPPYSSTSLPSNYLYRSSSSHSLPFNQYIPDAHSSLFSSSCSSQQHHQLQTPAPALSSSPPHSSCDFFDFNAPDPVRRVFSTGDLQGMNGHQASSGESYGQEGGSVVAAVRVGRYSAEERKERIERYRSKRNQRNFHKKITYACRKTLADSRPRVRGRFARNGGTETQTEVELEAEPATSNYNMFDNYSYNISSEPTQSSSGSSCHGNGSNDLWRQMQAVLAMEECCGYDDDLLASFADVFSMNLLS